MCCSTHPGREHFHREQECGAIRPDVEDELRDREDRHEPTGRRDVGHAGPDGIQNRRHGTEDELLADSADEIREEDSYVEGGKVACEDDDDVAYCCVPESLERRSAVTVADFT